ncbi:MAG: hypothetical protein H7331_08940, partial [Bacteroidia bacterium]|nr:hypothetical protein [Bacteroidia bacterium]
MFKHKFYTQIIVLLCMVCTFNTRLLAQYNNSWINYSTAHQYFKFPIYKTGVYRLDSTTLANAGFPANSISPQKIQMYARGIQIPLHIRGEQDGVLNKTDYIEFYAQKNNGDLDTALYITKGGNPYYSLFNDTINYFLTWSITAQNGLRYSVDTTKNYTSYTPKAYWYKTVNSIFNGEYSYGKAQQGASDYGYFAEEGWMGSTNNTIPNGYQLNIATPNVVNNLPLYINTAYATGNDAATGGIDNNLQIVLNNTILSDTSVDGYAYFKNTIKTNSNVLIANNDFKFKSINVGAGNTGRAYIAYFNINYPASTSANNKSNYEFYTETNPLPTTLYNITQQAGNKGNTRIINTTANAVTLPDTNSGICNALLHNIGISQNKYVVYNIDSTTQITALTKINGSGYFTNYSTTLLNNEMIVLSHTKLLPVAQQYATYRTSKGIASVVVNVNDLYDQYSFGVNKSPVAVQNFMQHIKKIDSTNNYLFIIGKGVNSSVARSAPNVYALNLVPTFGEPPSDVLLTTSNSLTNLKPLMHIGRIAATSQATVSSYLNKITEYETNTQPNKFSDDGEWMKQALHFAGGNSLSEAQNLQAYLDEYKDTLEAYKYGGHVSTYAKSTPLPIGQVSEVITQKINNGVSIMTFFAHASGAGFDQDIGQPSAYSNNNGKYPLIIGNSCFVGNIHVAGGLTFSEQWVLNPKGAIGFIAEPSLGFADKLAVYSRELYKQIARKNYGGSIGASMTNAISLLTIINNDLQRNTCVGMTLHGDPSLIINSPQKPDLALRNSTTSVSPSIITTANDSCIINLTAYNFGAAINTSVTVSIEHYYPGSTTPDTLYIKTLPLGINYTQTMVFGIRINATKAIGQNHFVLKIDPNDAVSNEISETNNTINIDVNILNSDVYPVYPSNYAIVPNNKITLKAATGLPLEILADYKFECDTTDVYNSPLLQTKTISSVGGIINWDINNNILKDTTVYFWRVAKVNGNSALKWKEQSFEYIPQKNGWGQAHFYQFEDDTYQYIDAVRAQRNYKFTNKPINLKCEVTGGSPTGNQYQFDTEIKEYNGCGFGSQIHVAILDSSNFTPWGTRYGGNNLANNFGNYNDNGKSCRQRVEYAFMYKATDSVQMQGLYNLLQTVPNGYHILMYTYINGGFNSWNPALKNYVTSLGGTYVNSLPDDYPYIFYVKKGDLSTAKQVIPANNKLEKITLNQPLYNDWYYGNITSTTIGPVSKWNSLHWNSTSVDANVNNDVVSIKVFAKLPNGQEKQLMRTLTIADKNVVLSDSIDATLYPTITLRVYTKDSLTRTPTQMNYWRVYYDPLPEGVINPKQNYSYTNSTTQEGDSIKLQVAFTNVTNVPMDSVLVRYWWQDANGKIYSTSNNTAQSFTYKRNEKLPANATINITASIPTV